MVEEVKSGFQVKIMNNYNPNRLQFVLNIFMDIPLFVFIKFHTMACLILTMGHANCADPLAAHGLSHLPKPNFAASLREKRPSKVRYFFSLALCSGYVCKK